MGEYKLPKVLLGCPTYAGKNYCVDEWMESAKNLRYANYDIFIVDNTNDNGENAQWLRDTYGVNVEHNYHSDVPLLGHLMAECQEIVRQRAIDEDYDYLFMLESDVIPPKNMYCISFVCLPPLGL